MGGMKEDGRSVKNEESIAVPKTRSVRAVKVSRDELGKARGILS